MVIFVPVSVETGRSGQKLAPSLLKKGQGLAMAFLSWGRGHAIVFLRRRESWPQPSSPALSEERAEELVRTFALISLRKGSLP